MSRFKTTSLCGSLVLLLLVLMPAELRAQGGGGRSLGARAEAREASRWTLQEWLAQKDRNRLMDLWLSMNSPSPFEFMLGLSHLSTTTKTNPATTDDSHISVAGEVRAYAQFMGLTIEHENDTKAQVSDLAGMLNIRLLGNSLQNSALTLHIGQRTRHSEQGTSTEQLRNLFVQASLQIYFMKYFGLDGLYRAYQPAKSDARAGDVSGTLTEAGLFIDFKAVRVFGAIYQEKEDVKDATSGAITGNRREGIKSGLKIFY